MGMGEGGDYHRIFWYLFCKVTPIVLGVWFSYCVVFGGFTDSKQTLISQFHNHAQ